MKSNKGFTLIELLAVIVILAIIALITTPIVLNIINQSKEAANKRSVEAYAKAVEYAVMEYEYEHNGELPADYKDTNNVNKAAFDLISDKVNYANSDVKCKVKINCDANHTGAVQLESCQVGSYTNTYYKYDGSAGSSNKGAVEDESGVSLSASQGVRCQ